MKKTLTKLLGGALLALFLVPQSAKATWTDINLDFTNDGGKYAWSTLTSSTTLYIHDDGTINATSTGAIGSITGKYHSTTYGLQNFNASITVPANVKIIYGQNDYGNAVTITNAASQTVGVINNNNPSKKWATGDTQNISTLYYTGESTTLNFSNCNYVGYFAIEALTSDEISALSATYSQDYNFESLAVFSNDIFESYNCTKHASHGWHIGTNGCIKVLVGEFSVVTLSQCQYSTEANMTITFPDGTTNTSVSQKSATDKATYSFTYAGGKSGLMTIGFPAGGAYLHGLSIQNYGTITTVGATGWATLSSSNILDFSSAIDNLDAAYIVTGTSGSSITTSAINAPIAVGQGILLKGSGEVKIPSAATATFDATGNKLVAGTGVAVNYNTGAGYNYVLAASGANAVFQQIVSGTYGSVVVPAGKAYLALTSAPGARTLSLDDETTGVQELKNSRIEELKSYYDLQGRKVAQPTKGLYIVNGKKVIIK